MDKNQEYSSIDLHHHSKYSYEAPKATLIVKEILEYYRLLAESKYDRVMEDGKEKLITKRAAFSIDDHNSSEGSYIAWKTINKNPERYKGFDFIPGIELGVDCSNVLSYHDNVNGDDKYVFKGMHLLAHAKPGREEEFFKRTWAISMLNKMVIKPEFEEINGKQVVKNNTSFYNKNIIANSNEEKQTQYISIGGQILAARNLVAKKYGVLVPYGKYVPCMKDGASYEEVRDIFLEQTYNYITNKCDAFNNCTKQDVISKISNTISYINMPDGKRDAIFPKKPQVVADLHNLNRVDILEIPKLLGDCATTCFAHPYTLQIHKNTAIPVKALQNVDISMLPDDVKKTINDKLADPQQVATGYFQPSEILHVNKKGCRILGDGAGNVTFQILNNQLLEKGVKIDGYEITNKHYKWNKLEETLNVVMDKYNMAVSFGTDDHFNEEDKFYYRDIKQKDPNSKKESYFSYYKTLATESSYFKLNRSGKDKLDVEENSFTLKNTL